MGHTVHEQCGMASGVQRPADRIQGALLIRVEPVMRFAAMKMMTVNTTRAPRIMMNMRKKALSFCADTVVAPKEVLG